MTDDTSDKHYYKQYYPSKALENYVKFFYYFHSDNIHEERILPIGTTEITIRINSENEDIFIANPATKFYLVKPKALCSIIGICLYPWALNSLFKIPQSEISNSKLPLRDILSHTHDKLAEQLKGKTDYLDIIKIIQSYLAGITDNKPNAFIIDAIHFIDQKNGLVDMNTLYKRYNISERRLQQLFNNYIGMPPKKYCQLKKFHFAVTGLNLNSNLTNLALNSGYYDQAHFINEFKSFAGICPGGFLKEKNTLNHINADTYFGV